MNIKNVIRTTLGASLALSLQTASLHALSIGSDDSKFKGTLDSTLTIGLGMRLNNPSPSNVGIGNGGTYPTLNEDNGNLNYGSGSFYSKAVKTIHELDLKYDDKWGIFVRGTSLYDFDVMRDRTLRTPLSDTAKDDLGHELKILDAYWSFDTQVSNNYVTFKVGNQVLSWGESTFIQNGLNVINPFDVSKFRVAGAELREGFLPVPMAVMSVEMNEKFSFETFYQWSHRKTRIDPEGTMFSDNDFVSPGSSIAHIQKGIGTDLLTSNSTNFGANGYGQVARREHPQVGNPEDEGNMGIGFKWYAEQLNYTEFGFYAMRYTSRLPVVSGFQGAQSAAVLGAAQTVGGFATALDQTVAFNALPAGTQQGLNNAYALAQGGAFGAALQGQALSGKTADQLRPQLIQGLATAGQLGTAAQGAAPAGLGAAINAQAGLIGQTVYIPNSYYFLEYPEDIMQYGVSFNTMIGTLALQGEYSYKVDQPIQIDDEVLLAAALGAPSQLGRFVGAGGAGIIRGWNPKDVSQVQFTMTKLAGKKFGSDNLALVGEAGYTKIHNMEDPSVLRYEAPGTAYGTGFGDDFSWGYRLLAKADYYNYWGEVSFHPSVAFNHDVNGSTPKPIGNFVEGRKSVTINLEARFQNIYSAKLSWTNFLGDDVHHTMRDRDFVTLSISRYF